MIILTCDFCIYYKNYSGEYLCARTSVDAEKTSIPWMRDIAIKRLCEVAEVAKIISVSVQATEYFDEANLQIPAYYKTIEMFGDYNIGDICISVSYK